jgi:hypothetical protein
MAVGNRCAYHATLSIRKKFALTSPSGGRSFGIVRSRTKATGLLLLLLLLLQKINWKYSTSKKCFFQITNDKDLWASVPHSTYCHNNRTNCRKHFHCRGRQFSDPISLATTYENECRTAIVLNAITFLMSCLAVYGKLENYLQNFKFSIVLVCLRLICRKASLQHSSIIALMFANVKWRFSYPSSPWHIPVVV